MMPVRLAIIGCGAIAELGHLPGAQVCRDVEISVLVDRDEARARALAARFGIAHVETDLTRASTYAEAAVVALPPHLHRSSAEALLGAGLHILMEKPLATTLADSDAMLAAAAAADRVLAVAMMRRFARSARYLKAAITSGMLGKIDRYVAESGGAAAWPSRSPFTFDVAQSGGGALISNGCHDVDLMLWLMGPIAEFTFHTDSLQRMEGNCRLDCRMQNGGQARIEVSRTRTLSNTIRVEGDHAVAVAPLMGETIQLFPVGAPLDIQPPGAPPSFDFAAAMARQLSSFASAVRGQAPPMADGAAGRDMIALVEQCYARAEPLVLPWDAAVTVPARGA